MRKARNDDMSWRWERRRTGWGTLGTSSLSSRISFAQRTSLTAILQQRRGTPISRAICHPFTCLRCDPPHGAVTNSSVGDLHWDEVRIEANGAHSLRLGYAGQESSGVYECFLVFLVGGLIDF